MVPSVFILCDVQREVQLLVAERVMEQRTVYGVKNGDFVIWIIPLIPWTEWEHISSIKNGSSSRSL